MNLGAIQAKKAAGLNLTPLERSLLRLVEGLGVAAAVAALPLVATALADPAPDWNVVGKTALAAAAAAVLSAVKKYADAAQEPPLADPNAAAAAAVLAGVLPIASAPPAPSASAPAAAPDVSDLPTVQMRAVPSASVLPLASTTDLTPHG